MSYCCITFLQTAALIKGFFFTCKPRQKCQRFTLLVRPTAVKVEADLVNQQPNTAWVWSQLSPNTYTTLNLLQLLATRITTVCAQMCAPVWRSLAQWTWWSESHSVSISYFSISSLSPVTALNFCFALCLSASMCFILAVAPSLLFRLCPGLEMSLRNLEIDEVLNKRQPSFQH